MDSILNQPIQIFWSVLGWAALIVAAIFALALLLHFLNHSPRLVAGTVAILLRFVCLLLLLATCAALFLWGGWKMLAFLWSHSSGFYTIAGIPLILAVWGALVYAFCRLVVALNKRYEIERRYLALEETMATKISSLDTLGSMIGKLTKKRGRIPEKL
jgi:hypothetical protein